VKRDEKKAEPPTPGFNFVLTGIPFICADRLDTNGYEWEKDEVEGAEHTGNESRAAEEDSIYLHKALLVDHSI